jgi:octaprenyl-diphosphate synthase
VLVAAGRPARNSGGFVVGNDMTDTGIAQNITCLPKPFAVDQNAPRQGSNRALQHAHVEVGNDEVDPSPFEQRADKGQKHGIVATQQLLHSLQNLASFGLKAVRLDLGRGAADNIRGKRASLDRFQEQPLGVVVKLAGPNEARASLAPLVALVEEDMAHVNRIILDRARSNVELIPELARHLIDSGGKRLRPMLTLAAAKLCGYRGDGHVRLAASVEFMHTATLLHDDVVDESNLRRGKTAARLLWGNEASVLVGDYLLGQAFKMMVDVGSLGALRILSDAAAIIAEGEVMQLITAKNTETTEDDYLAVIDAKTAALFAAAAEVGAVIAARPKSEAAALRSYGRNLGLAFQLVDDALDYAGEPSTLGKSVGDDFREGKITLPVMLCYRRGNAAERAFWHRTLKQGDLLDDDLKQAMGLMKRHNALADTLERARHYGAIAGDDLAIFPASDAKAALLEAIEFCVDRPF